MINKIMAIALVVADLNKATDFYKNKLGLKIKTKDEGFVDFETKGTTLALLEEKTAEDLAGKKRVSVNVKMPRSVILAWDAVKNVDTVYQKLNKKGVKFKVKPKTMPWGQRVAYFSDPDGNLWEISQWVK